MDSVLVKAVRLGLTRKDAESIEKVSGYKSPWKKIAVWLRNKIGELYEEHKELVEMLEKNGLFVPDTLKKPWVYAPVRGIEDVLDELRVKTNTKFLEDAVALFNVLRAVNETLKCAIADPGLHRILAKASRGVLAPDEIMLFASKLLSNLEKYLSKLFITKSYLDELVIELSEKKGVEYEVVLWDEKATSILREFPYYNYFSFSRGHLYLLSHLCEIAYIVEAKHASPVEFSVLPSIPKKYAMSETSSPLRIRFKGVLPVNSKGEVSHKFKVKFPLIVHNIYSQPRVDWSVKLNWDAARRVLQEGYDIEVFPTGTAMIGEQLVVDNRFIVNGQALVMGGGTPYISSGKIESIHFSAEEISVRELSSLEIGPVKVSRVHGIERSAILLRPSNNPLDILFLPRKDTTIRTYRINELPEAVWDPSTLEYAYPEYIPVKADSTNHTAKAYIKGRRVLVTIKNVYGWGIEEHNWKPYVAKSMEEHNVVLGSFKGIIPQKQYDTPRTISADLRENIPAFILNNRNTMMPIYIIEDERRKYPNNSKLAHSYTWLGKVRENTPLPQVDMSSSILLGYNEFKINISEGIIHPIIEFGEEGVKVRLSNSHIVNTELYKEPKISEFKLNVITKLNLDLPRYDAYMMAPIILYSNTPRRRTYKGKVYHAMSKNALHVIITLEEGTTLVYTISPFHTKY